MTRFRYAVSVMPREGILDPQGRAVEVSLPHLGVTNVGQVRVGRRIELEAEAQAEAEARAVVERLAADLLANPLIESWSVEPMAADDAPAAPGTDADPSGAGVEGDAGTSPTPGRGGPA